MDWIRDNKFLAGYIAVFVVVGALLGYLLVSARSAYLTTIEDYQNTSQMVGNLSGKDLYPDEETLKLVQDESGELRDAVNKLHEELLGYNRPLDVTMTGGGFQQKLTQRVVGLKKRSVLEGVKLDDGFSLGLDRYTAELPNEKAVPDLNFHLESLDYLANALFDAGVDSIEVFQRIPLAIEEGESAEAKSEDDAKDGKDEATSAADYIRRYPVRICVKGRPETLETFMNGIANAPKEEFFFNVQYLTINNEKDEGPEKGIEFEAGVRNSEGLENESENDADLDPSAIENAAGVVDSRVVLGNEKIEACFVIEAIRVEPVPTAEAEEEESN